MKNAAQIFALFSTLAFTFACGGAVIPDDIPSERNEGCGDDHERVGETATFTTEAHDVSGTVRLVDNCTIALENFTYDGGGVDVRAIISAERDYGNGIVLSEDLRRDEGYSSDTVMLFLPDGVTLDDVGGLSIWCVPFGADFGEAAF